MDGNDPMPVSSRSKTRLTYDDFLLFPDDGKQHEIIDGVHYVTPSPNLRHQELIGRLHLAIGNYLATRRHVGRVFLSRLDVVMSYYDVVEPDLLFVGADQLDILTKANVEGAPALVVEVLSPSTRKRDAGIKRQLFERAGVREYWLVDPDRDRVQVFRRNAEGSLSQGDELTAAAHAALTSPLLPELSVPLDALFERW